MDNANQKQQKSNSSSMKAATKATATTTTTTICTSKPKREVSWPMVLFFIHLNILGLYGVYVMFTHTSVLTVLFSAFLAFLGILGATTGAHRLWAHRTYEASTALKVFLMICQTLAGQGSIYRWVQLHRLHHAKFRKPEDPFHSSRSFYDAHIKAQITNLSAEQEQMLLDIEMSDLEEDKIVMFQKKYYWLLYIVIHVLIPVNTPFEYWNDSLSAALFVAFSLRYWVVLNSCWLINSAHFVWALNKSFKASDSNSVFFITKSYWPQYHYLLPCDYLSDEYGGYSSSLLTSMIRVYAALDLASNLKTISSVAVRDGLTIACEHGSDYVESIKKQAELEISKMPNDHYLNHKSFL